MQYQPQLAQLVKHPPDGPEWIHELKYDGYRIGCLIENGRVSLISRNGHDWTAAFPEIVAAAARLRARRALLDGEVCIVLPDGRTSFQALQNIGGGSAGSAGSDRLRRGYGESAGARRAKAENPAGHSSRVRSRRGLTYFVFDLLRLDDRDLTREPLERRKSALSGLLGAGQHGRIRFAGHIDGRGPDAFAQACRLGLEGIVSKRRDDPYQLGKRGGWVKTKCVRRQEFVIGGFTDPEGSRGAIGALLIGYYQGDRLVFAGKVGTGFTQAGARDLRATLERLETDACPYATRPPGWLGRHAHWVRPQLVAEVSFTEWTSGGHVRHPSFQGLRRDKPVRAVVREEEAGSAPAAAPPSTSEDDTVVRGVRITHPDRVMYPKPGLTKLDVARYYDTIAPWMLPHVLGRPLTLVRCGDGITGECLFMKHSKVWAPRALRRVRIQEQTKVGEYLVIESAEGLVSLAQMDVLEIHTWNTRADRVDTPDRIVIDLDPGARIAWRTVVDAARLVRSMLAAVELDAFVKTTGGRGLHVVVPTERRHDWRVCLEFARGLGAALVRRQPDLFTTEFARRGREARILIDYLRNNRTNTSIAAFSTRARPGAPVSIPMSWADLKPSLHPERFTVETVPRRFRRRPDPWAAYWTTRQRVTASAIASVQQLA